ncbi:Hypothetical predicted protein [Cloeon dipterum]|uniref:C2H2-type domain-containing protein n=1 Tax=Cloeon dipterum TaxID=197152 RepID=A0A8S1BT76_9INSE|nr:Hypothetical predicted protein [Cloeon dipterum]
MKVTINSFHRTMQIPILPESISFFKKFCVVGWDEILGFLHELERCNICGRRLSKKVSLAKHIQNTHANETGLFNCLKCSEVVKGVAMLKYHKCSVKCNVLKIAKKRKSVCLLVFFPAVTQHPTISTITPPLEHPRVIFERAAALRNNFDAIIFIFMETPPIKMYLGSIEKSSLLYANVCVSCASDTRLKAIIMPRSLHPFMEKLLPSSSCEGTIGFYYARINKCNICGVQYFARKSLWIHLQEAHANLPALLTCSICLEEIDLRDHEIKSLALKCHKCLTRTPLQILPHLRLPLHLRDEGGIVFSSLPRPFVA